MRVTLSTKRGWLLVYVVASIKIIYFIYYKSNLEGTIFGGGNDADYYNAYALGYTPYAVNSWPIFLRFLNEIGFYNRYIISWIIFVTSLTLTPYLYYKVVKIQDEKIEPVMVISIFLIIFYPTIFFLTIDIYREVFMFCFFLLSLQLYKKNLETSPLKSKVYFIIYLGIAFLLYYLRPYLGFALAITPFVYLIFSKTKRYFKTWIILYFVTLVSLKIFGGIDQILLYRENFAMFGSGKSTIGIGLIDKNPIMFLVYYFYSIMTQMFGLFFININSLIVFLLETIPFIMALIYLRKNIRFMSKFTSFLVTFFVIYSTIWLLGNDNLGTAVRLRIPSYMVIFASMLIVYQTKIVAGYEKIKGRRL